VRIVEEMNRENNITYIRGITALIVLLGHVLVLFNGTAPLNWGGYRTENSIITFVRNFIYTYHMPLFMSVSGYLFYFEIEKNSDLLCFIWKKFKRLIIPFVIMLYCYYKPMSYLAGTSQFIEQGSWQRNVIEYLKINTTGALWYLYVLFAIFVFNKLISFIWRRHSTIFIALVLFVAASYFAQIHYSGGTIHHLLMYNFYFYLGAWIRYYYDSVVNRNKILLMVVFLISAATVSIGAIDIKYLRYLLVMIAAISAILAAYAFTDKYRCSVPSKPIAVLDDYSYGIYLFHTPIIELIAAHMHHSQALLIILVMFFAGLILSMLLTRLIRAAHLNFILGEPVKKRRVTT
jgi:fucose 4-O-acetylase-like acetyltransferase